ncbi:hypothetical protein IGI04_024042 [Brassica rapa subsp. trilocularis]|uniref:Uncharacterized protein n=1 Tax=Brassica rapa subsp. trilocularis TaxID=1813537 RepID=A0ABQ7M8Z7_BRACM|nr:hypothetical protein IGI04_024042 [Brassica rapa subsp. trilocularis]
MITESRCNLSCGLKHRNNEEEELAQKSMFFHCLREQTQKIFPMNIKVTAGTLVMLASWQVV